jgi:hypothetical protein
MNKLIICKCCKNELDKNLKKKYKNLNQKKCKKCELTLSISNFDSNGRPVNGRKLYKPICKKCRVVINKKQYLKRKNQLKAEKNNK